MKILLTEEIATLTNISVASAIAKANNDAKDNDMSNHYHYKAIKIKDKYAVAVTDGNKTIGYL